MLVIWAVPSTRDRVLRVDPSAAGQRRLAALGAARSTGSLAFGSSAARPARGRGGGPDGTPISGGPAVAFALSRLPVTAWFALPTLLLPAVRRARRPLSRR